MQCNATLGFNIASPTIVRYFRCISLLGSLQNAILLLCMHAQSHACCIHSLLCHGIETRPQVSPHTMPRSCYTRVSEEDWLIVEYKCFAISWTHGHLAIWLCKNVTTKCCYSLISYKHQTTPLSSYASYTIAWYSCCSSALEKNKLKKQVGMVGPKSKQTRIASWQDACLHTFS